MNPIIEKIKKLLRMKRGGTPDEVATALRMAQELASKHGIDLDQVNPDDEQTREKPITHGDILMGARESWESKYSALVVQQFFKVRMMIGLNQYETKYVIRFIGEAWDIQIATYVYHFLCGHFRREWKQRRGRCTKRQSFMYGMYIGLCSKLSELQPAEVTPGIVKLDRALAYRQQHWPDVSSANVEPDKASDTAKYRGYVAGRQTNIRSGVDAGEKLAELAPLATKLLA